MMKVEELCVNIVLHRKSDGIYIPSISISAYHFPEHRAMQIATIEYPINAKIVKRQLGNWEVYVDDVCIESARTRYEAKRRLIKDAAKKMKEENYIRFDGKFKPFMVYKYQRTE